MGTKNIYEVYLESERFGKRQMGFKGNGSLYQAVVGRKP
jgi:hypothetical protein